MNSKFNEKFHLTIDEKVIFSFFLASTKDGFTFGIVIPNRDIHLTVIFNKENNLLQPHITDKNVPEGRRQQPSGRYTEVSLIVEEFTYHIKSWIKTYHHNQKGWVLKPSIKQKIQDITLPKEKEKGVWNLPFYTEIELPDFNDENCWTRVRLREMVERSEIIFIQGKTIIKYAFIIDKKRMLLISERQFENIFNYIFDVLGFDDYIRYVKRKVPRKDIIRL